MNGLFLWFSLVGKYTIVPWILWDIYFQVFIHFTWRIIPFSKWLITMMIGFVPNSWGYGTPCQMAYIFMAKKMGVESDHYLLIS